MKMFMTTTSTGRRGGQERGGRFKEEGTEEDRKGPIGWNIF